ncbi:alkyl sulfatase-like hydrolase [Hyaloraphidium curvatum]|nr:alkyl sulfatase-like hydrolase [Hyaloraphidium curvatum]
MPGPVTAVAERMWSGAEALRDPMRPTGQAAPPAGDGKLRTSPTKVREGLPVWEHFYEDKAAGVRVTAILTFANVYTIETPAGLVMIDGGSKQTAPLAFQSIRQFTPQPLSTCIYTHGHVDHVFGPTQFMKEPGRDTSKRIQIVAHENVPRRFARYNLTNGYNSLINAVQFQGGIPTWPTDWLHPDVLYRDSLSLNIGGVALELHHAKGETDDGTWVHMPQADAIFAGDLVIWAAPNCGNPQKVQRFPLEWAQALRAMQSKGASMLFPGHGPPILGKANVEQALDDAASLLEAIVDHTLAGMNAGKRLDEIIHTLAVPAGLLERPYLRPIYDEPEFVVRNVWRLYGGWYDQNPSHLKPPPEPLLAVAVAKLAGSPLELARRASEQPNTAVGCSLVEHAWLAAAELRPAPADRAEINRIRAELYAKRARETTSLMAQSILMKASDTSRKLAEEAASAGQRL